MSQKNAALGVAVVLSVAGSVGTSQAAVVSVTNPSFEADVLADGGFTDVTIGGALTGWGISVPGTGNSQGAVGVQNWGAAEFTNSTGQGVPPGGDGPQGLYVNNYVNGGTSAGFQNVGTLLSNTTYTLIVAIGQRNDRVNDAGTLSLINVATTDNSTNVGTLLSSTTGVSSVAGSFADFSTTFTTGAVVAGNLLINLSETNGGGLQAAFDNVRLNAVSVPEPASLGLVALCGAGLLRRSRR